MKDPVMLPPQQLNFTHPVYLPDGFPEGTAILVDFPDSDIKPPEGVAPGSVPGIIYYGPGTKSVFVWIPPKREPKED